MAFGRTVEKTGKSEESPRLSFPQRFVYSTIKLPSMSPRRQRDSSVKKIKKRRESRRESPPKESEPVRSRSVRSEVKVVLPQPKPKPKVKIYRQGKVIECTIKDKVERKSNDTQPQQELVVTIPPEDKELVDSLRA